MRRSLAYTGVPPDPYFLGFVSTTRALLLDRLDDVERIAEALKVRRELQPLHVTRLLGINPPPVAKTGG